MNDLLRLKRNSIRLGLCDEYTKKWNDCKSKEDLMKIATDANGCAFLADGFAFGWGLSLDAITSGFSDYINGKYVVEHSGYKSEVWAGKEGLDIEAKTTNIVLLGCSGRIYVPYFVICNIFVAECHDLVIENDGRCEVQAYGGNSVEIMRPERAKRKDIAVSNWANKAI